MIGIQIEYKQHEDKPAHVNFQVFAREDTVEIERAVVQTLLHIFHDAVKSTGLNVRFETEIENG